MAEGLSEAKGGVPGAHLWAARRTTGRALLAGDLLLLIA